MTSRPSLEDARSETSRFFPRRSVHLDIHTGPDAPGVGADFDPVAIDAEPRGATLQPAGTPLPLHWSDGIASTTVTVLDGHAMIVLERSE